MEIEFFVRIDKRELSLERTVALAVVLGASLFPILCALVFGRVNFLWWSPVAYAVGLFAWKRWVRYRALARQFKKPDRIRLLDHALVYFRGDTPTLEIPLQSIANTKYDEGIALYMKKPSPRPLQFLDPSFSLRSRRRGADLRLPWFDVSVQARLQDIVHPEKTLQASRL